MLFIPINIQHVCPRIVSTYIPALSLDLNYYVVDSYASNSYAQDPPTDKRLYVHIDDQYIKWYNIKIGKDIRTDEFIIYIKHYREALNMVIYGKN